ncbi:MAG: ZIP family metal transporter [Solirubrobacterales bacterium]|nr:ZIP family metal transporter [Solirubrobacterales bacterium]
MTFAQTAGLGAIAGMTIFIGLPLGRVKGIGPKVRLSLAMFSVGVLAFLFVDVMGQGFGMVEDSVTAVRDSSGSLGKAVLYVAILAGGFLLGSAGLGWLDARMKVRPTALAPIAGGSAATSLSPTETQAYVDEADLARRKTLRTGLMIATAIGIHNLGEGLAIGVSARSGEISLATVLVVGFALHNATEGFGIVGPLGKVTPSWRWLGLAGLIAGSPTLIGTMIGWNIQLEALSVACYALAGGAILYVIGEIWNAMRRLGHRELGLLMLGVGFMIGVLTDLVVVYGGA